MNDNGNTSKTLQLVEFSMIFDEPKKDLKSYLTGISRNTLLMLTTFLLGLYNRKSKYENYYELISMFFGEQNNAFANEIYNKLKAYEQKVGNQLRIISPLTALQIFEYCFDNTSDEESQNKDETEINVFKAILFQNEVNTAAQMEAFVSTEQFEIPYRIPLSLLSQSLSSSDLINYDKNELLACQIIKSIFLFEFLESNKKTQVLLNSFLGYFGCVEWKDYLKRIIPLIIPILNPSKEGHMDIDVKQGESFEQDCEFIDRLIILDSDAIEDYDFKKIRAKPFYKIKDGVYRIIFSLFNIEILHKGVYFKLNEINAKLEKKDNIKNLRSFYCDDFSERFLVYNILGSIYLKRYVKFSGAKMKEYGIDAEPDYYIRNGNVTFLFESKDVLINAEIKADYNFVRHEAEFKKKLYFEKKDDKKSNKAVLQLMKNIERCLTLSFPFDREYKCRNQVIYPIIILHDHIYRVPGLNYLVNTWHILELKTLKEKGINVDKVQPLTIIDIDTFIFHQDIFRDKKIKLDDIIDRYHKYTKIDDKMKYSNVNEAKQKLSNKSISFSTFLTAYVTKIGVYQAPKMIFEKGLSLFS